VVIRLSGAIGADMVGLGHGWAGRIDREDCLRITPSFLPGRRRGVAILLAIACVAGAFYAGTRYEKHQSQIKGFLASFRPQKPAASAAVAESPAVQASLHSVVQLDTTLLPLLVDTVSIPPALGVESGFGGGLAVVNDTIVVVDLAGSFFKVAAKGDIIERLALPPLPDRVGEYSQFVQGPKEAGKLSRAGGFHAHDVEASVGLDGVRLFVSHERFLPERGTTALAVSTILLDSKDLAPLGPWDIIYESQPLKAKLYSGFAGGGRMIARSDSLYLTVGDYNLDNVYMASKLEAQNPDTDFGKILKIDIATKTKHVVSSGHRNPQGLVITSAGTIYSTEHGPRGGDELNVIVAGGNYGWPVTTLGIHYTTYDWPNHRAELSEQGFIAPLYAWVPSIAVSNIIEIANFHAAWDGDLLVESLKAQSLFRIRRDTDGHVVYSEPIPLGHRLRDIAALPNGTLVLWTDDAQLLFLNVDRAKLAGNSRPRN
jgi:hypothetical protein